MAEAIRLFELNTGAKMPSVGFGTYNAAPAVLGDVIATAIKVGYRHIDCASIYGNEKEIGYALKKQFVDGVVKRQDLWITSKLWCADHAPEDVPGALDRTLRDLQLDYVDLYLIHWPVSFKKGSVGVKPENLTQPDIPRTWRAMEALYESGKARAIGVCNFSSKKLGDLLEVARVPPAVNQVECHPSWQQPTLHAFCKSKGIHLSGYSPLGRNEVLKNPILITVSEKLGKSPAQMALRWGLQMGHSVLPKSSNEARIKENFDVFDWSIAEDLFAKVSDIEQEKLVKGTPFVHETFGAYKTIEELWDGEVNSILELNTGAEIPSVGLGTAQAAPGVVGDSIAIAIKVGYRHVDCAHIYGNEKEIGHALKKLLADGIVKREELWITSKLWCTYHLPEDVPKALDQTLRDLQLDYVDLYLIHWPVSLKKGSIGVKFENLTQPDIPSTWRAMEALYESGKARAIGVSNFSVKKLGDLLDVALVPPAVNQVECHPTWQQPRLHVFCESKGIHLSGYSTLGSQVKGINKNVVLKNPILNMVAEKLCKSPAQVALRWGLQMGHSVLPKSTNEARIKENLNVFDWSIPEDLLAKLSEIEQEKMIKGFDFVHETFGGYKSIEELWDGEI